MRTTNFIRFFVILLILFLAFGYWYQNKNLKWWETDDPTEQTATEALDLTDPDTEVVSGWNPQVEDPSEPKSERTQEKPYVIRDTEQYLYVYAAAEERVILNTGIPTETLEETLQGEVRKGISFATMEEVYNFLENCSS